MKTLVFKLNRLPERFDRCKIAKIQEFFAEKEDKKGCLAEYSHNFENGYSFCKTTNTRIIPEEKYNEAKTRKCGRTINKVRNYYPLDHHIPSAIDIYTGEHSGIKLICVFVQDYEEEVFRRNKPNFIGEEVTEDYTYSPFNLAMGNIDKLTNWGKEK